MGSTGWMEEEAIEWRHNHKRSQARIKSWKTVNIQLEKRGTYITLTAAEFNTLNEFIENHTISRIKPGDLQYLPSKVRAVVMDWMISTKEKMH